MADVACSLAGHFHLHTAPESPVICLSLTTGCANVGKPFRVTGDENRASCGTVVGSYGDSDQSKVSLPVGSMCSSWFMA